MICIYKITNKNSGKVYIGQTKNFKQRWTVHKYWARVGRGGAPLHKAIKSQGADSFLIEVLVDNLSREDANIKEIELISFYKSNASGNGYGAVGNYVNNYYVSNKSGLINLCADNASCGTAYVSGNFNQPAAIGGTSVSTEYSILAKYKVTTTDAKTAARLVLDNVGTYKRNSDELFIINSIILQ